MHLAFPLLTPTSQNMITDCCARAYERILGFGQGPQRMSGHSGKDLKTLLIISPQDMWTHHKVSDTSFGSFIVKEWSVMDGRCRPHLQAHVLDPNTTSENAAVSSTVKPVAGFDPSCGRRELRSLAGSRLL